MSAPRGREDEVVVGADTFQLRSRRRERLGCPVPRAEPDNMRAPTAPIEAMTPRAESAC